MEILIICIAAFFSAILTFFSGFGLGTILTPVFAIFFPIDIAIALTGVVHFFNNLFKVVLIGKNSDKTVLVRFGIPAILASFAGAWLLVRITEMPVLFQHQLFSQEYEITPVKLIIAVLLVTFAILEIAPAVQRIQFDKNKLPVGGLLSGFFGGLTGIQGAIRSAFLIRSGLTKEAYIATGVVIACFIDFTRLAVYATRFSSANLQDNLSLVFAATVSAIAGAYLGNKLLRKITLRFIQITVAVMLIFISIALGMGII